MPFMQMTPTWQAAYIPLRFTLRLAYYDFLTYLCAIHSYLISMPVYNNFFARRNLAIDMLRALTMFTMIFVNDLGTVHDVPHWMLHALPGEDFAGLSDFVFPCFLFAMGMSIPYAIESRYSRGLSGESTLSHILKRTFALLIMGVCTVNAGGLSPDLPYTSGSYYLLMVAAFILIWNKYPSGMRHRHLFTGLQVLGWGILLFLMLTCRHTNGTVFRSSWWGILGLIGWAYIFCATTYLLLRRNFGALLGVFVGLITICVLNTPLREEFGGRPILDFPEGNFYGQMLGIVHLGNGCLASLTMGGVILSVVAGKLAGISASRRLWYGIGSACSLLAAAQILHRFYIVSKLGETPCWVFYTFALSVALYFTLDLLNSRGLSGWFVIIRPAGTATLTAYVLPYVVYGTSYLTGWHMPEWFTNGIWGIVNCICFSFVIILITGLLEKIHIKLKI